MSDQWKSSENIFWFPSIAFIFLASKHSRRLCSVIWFSDHVSECVCVCVCFSCSCIANWKDKYQIRGALCVVMLDALIGCWEKVGKGIRLKFWIFDQISTPLDWVLVIFFFFGSSFWECKSNQEKKEFNFLFIKLVLFLQLFFIFSLQI